MKLDKEKVKELARKYKVRDYKYDKSIPCPFHDDNRNSGSLNLAKQVYFCHAGCGGYTLDKVYEHLNGDIKTMESLQSDLFQSVYLEDIPGSQDQEDGRVDAKNEIPERLQGSPVGILEQGESLRDFILSRGISKDTYEEVGAYPDVSRGYILFPNDGATVGRNFLDDPTKPKYVNSMGDRPLYGYNRINKHKDVILVEGIYDYLSLYELGYKNVVASLGAEFNEKQAYSFRNQTVFVLFDRDYAGYSGALQAKEHLVKMKAHPIIIELPEGWKDPNDAFLKDRMGLSKWILDKTSQYDSTSENYLLKFFSNEKPLRYYATGIHKFDYILGGGYKEGCHGIAGMPGVGKTSLALFLTRQFVQQTAKVLYCTYEITPRQCWARITSQITADSMNRLKWSDIEMNPSSVPEDVRSKVMELGNNIKITSGFNVHEISRAAHSYDVIVVDYIQRMPGDSDDDTVRVKRNIEVLADLARDEGKIVLILSSMSREQYGKVSMSVFKESGNVEYVIQSASLLTNQATLDQQINPSIATLALNVVKNTRGIEDKVHLIADMECGVFDEETKAA